MLEWHVWVRFTMQKKLVVGKLNNNKNQNGLQKPMG